MNLADAGGRVRVGYRDDETYEGDPVAAEGVLRRPDADGQGDAQRLDVGLVPFVVPAQTAGDRRHEAVVDRAAGSSCRTFQVTCLHLDHVEMTTEPSRRHDR